MAVATGAQRRISHVKESSYGTASGTAFQTDRALADAGGEVTREQYLSEEFRADRAYAALRLGTKLPTFRLPFELSYGTQEDHFESALYAAWVAAGTPITSLTVTVVAGVTNTMAATGIGGASGSLIAVGDWVKVSGFTGGYVANNGFFRVTARAADLITLGEAKDSASASMLTAATSQSSITVTRMGYLLTGTTEKSLAFEEAFTDISVFAEYLGCVCKGMSLSIPTKGIIKGSFDYLCQQLVGPAGTTYTGSIVAATTTEPMDGATSGMALRINGVPCATITDLGLTLDNAVAYRDSAFQTMPIGIKCGRSKLSGSMGLYFDASTYWTKYLAETPIALGAKLLDPAGATGYAIDIPTVKITSFPKPTMQENDSVSNIQWHALRDSTLGYVNAKISKLA